MKSFKELLEENTLFTEGHDRYPGDKMTMKELRIAINSAKNILDMIDDGAEVMRWQISAIVKASEELASVYTSMSADENEEEEDAVVAYTEYGFPSMYEEMDFKVSVDGLPDMYMKGNSPSEVKTNLRKVVRNPDMIQSVDRITRANIKKIFRDKAQGKDDLDETTNIIEELELSEERTKVEIPKSRYLTLAKAHGAHDTNTSGKVATTPKGTLKYKGAVHLDHDKKTDTNIRQIYSHGDHGIATIEKHTHNPTGRERYFMYQKKKS